MDRHGSESYFVLGEGLLGESVGGRDARSRDRRRAPPFRFSRMGPSGINRQLGEPNQRKIGQAMVAGAGAASPIPAGFTYLGQFVDHDLTFDKTNVMLGQNVSPAQLLQARSPSLDLDSLYGAGPSDPASAKFYEADGIHLKKGRTDAIGGISAKQGFDLPRGAGSTAAAKRKAIIPDPRNDENLAVAQTHARVHPLPQPGRRHASQLGTSGAALRQGPGEGRQALPVDAPDRLPAPDLCAGRRHRRVHQRTEGVRGGGDADRRPDDADRVLGRRLPPRALDDPRRLQLEPHLRCRERQPRAAVRVLRGQRRPGWWPAASEQLDRGLPAALRLHGGRPRRPRCSGCQVQPRDADRHGARRSTRNASRVPRGGGEPRVPQPGTGEDGAARDRRADGHVPEEQGRDAAEQAHERADTRRVGRSRSGGISRSLSALRSSRTRPSGSTSCARPSSTAAS